MDADKEAKRVPRKVAVLTGANMGGVGYGIARRLLELVPKEQLTLVLACRSYTRTVLVRASLLALHPDAHIDIVIVDLNQVASVLHACTEIKQRYDWIDYLFLNAGYLGALGLRWGAILPLFFKDPVGLMESSDATLQARGEVNDDGLGKVFACNVFGHYVMMRQLADLLDNATEGGRVIWSSSSTAFSTSFKISDWQGVENEIPYESSKWACDMLAVVSGEYFMQQGMNIHTFTVSPGVVASRVGNLPLWIIYLRSLIHLLFRLFGVASQNINGYRGAMAAVFVALQPLVVLNGMLRYTSETTRWGTTYVKPYVLDGLDMEVAWELHALVDRRYELSTARE
ncbi:hypothetical protein BC940DRAFT_287212 [Gongronella butleri]|nr:hypothetical protein BC940DRAFT_287212 [Gongronella butleri]